MTRDSTVYSLHSAFSAVLVNLNICSLKGTEKGIDLESEIQIQFQNYRLHSSR